MSEAHDRQHAPKHGSRCAWCQQCNTTFNVDNKAVVHASQTPMHANMITAQERHCHMSTEEAERCAQQTILTTLRYAHGICLVYYVELDRMLENVDLRVACLQMVVRRYGEVFSKVSKQLKVPTQPVTLLHFEGNHYHLLLK